MAKNDKNEVKKNKVLIKFKTAKGKIVAIALAGAVVFSTWAGIHLYKNSNHSNKLREDDPIIGDTELPTDDAIEQPTEPGFEIPTEPGIEQPTHPSFELPSDEPTQESETSSNQPSIETESQTEQPSDTPIIQDSIDKSMAVKLLTTLTTKVQDFLNDKNSALRPIITGIEELSMTPSNSGYTFLIKVEGFMNTTTPSYIQITANSTDSACAELYQMFTQNGNINSASLVNMLNNTLASEYTNVSSCKSLKSLNISDKNTAIKTVFNKSGIPFVDNENYKLKVFVNSTPIVENGINRYEIKINTSGQLNSYFTTLTISSDKLLDNQTLSIYVNAILSGQTIDIPYTIQTAEIENSNIYGIINTLNSKLEEKELGRN